ncbi:hypothetical protein ABL78_3872 [Leptomonas seymouri]|uniref:Uncharacterized protein n=1 Tax=Leptomonas seymouri TaxID=5684 RepID=A0A0N1I5I8_LEPSE|nr:hypothetical protein ABL78_3872 [Leptomonas seymouri]|eukprot:KPI87060.1 hypothetical protein ABL78_3872 [Leptomonas seymouri]
MERAIFLYYVYFVFTSLLDIFLTATYISTVFIAANLIKLRNGNYEYLISESALLFVIFSMFLWFFFIRVFLLILELYAKKFIVRMRRSALITYLKSSRILLPFSQRHFSQYSDGSDGVGWKQRYLQERRDIALEFLGDVKKRVPIHDAVRQRASINRKATGDIHCPTLFDDSYSSNGASGFDGNIIHTKLVDDLVDDLLQDENAMDKLQNVDFSDLPLLDSELLGDDVSDEATLRNWLKLKRDTADYQSYASIPESERTAWSAWYLRHIKGKEGN